ncbi:hypothetical protein G3A_03170 [Bacillus sp. 17376]|nr:hypothetical protein G3A_03170 [Bacillus sp. 17376]
MFYIIPRDPQIISIFGKTLSEISDMLGRTRESIRKKIKRLTDNNIF